jgi:hypothetical protein
VEKILRISTPGKRDARVRDEIAPKGAIDLELSTARLLFASIRRVQDRDWVLRQLGSLETVLTPTTSLQQFLSQTEPEPLAGEVLRLADGVKTVKQIGAVSSLGEFEVCKVLAAALVAGALSRDGAPAIPASPATDDAFSFPRPQESFSIPPPPRPSFGDATMGIPEPPPASDSMSYDTIFQAAVVKSAPAAEDSESTVFDPGPAKRRPSRRAPPARGGRRGRPSRAPSTSPSRRANRMKETRPAPRTGAAAAAPDEALPAS